MSADATKSPRSLVSLPEGGAPPRLTGRSHRARWSGLLAGLALAAALPGVAHAALTVEPLTWDVIGLDSNNVTVGPNKFPVGARVCTDVAATGVEATFVWDSANPYINLRPGTADPSLPVPLSDQIDLLAGECTDFYFEVEVTRNPAAYGTTRRYHIEVTADAGATSGSTPVPRELFVERLISQNRNSVNDMLFSSDGGATWISILGGGTMTLLVGGIYDIQIDSNTATAGYEQIEAFINFPNTIFQILEVDTTYTAESSPTMTPPYDKLYGDACDWEANPLSPNYRACNGVGKAGGRVVTTYTVQILSVPGAPLVQPEPLNTLIYDFSGSSYHYNANYDGGIRYAYIIDPETLNFQKSFVPSTIAPGGTSTLTIRIPNPSTGPLTGVNFSDPLPAPPDAPAAMTIADPSGLSVSGCGSGTVSAPANGNTISLSSGTIGANSMCVISVNVTVPSAGTYTNITNNLFIGGTTPGTGIDTGNNTSAVLTAATTPVGGAECRDGVVMARWTIPTVTSPTTIPPDTAGAASQRAANVSTASVSASQPANTSTNIAGSTLSAPATNAWQTWGYKTVPTQSLAFVVDTKNYSNVAMTWDWRSPNPGPTAGTVVSSQGGSPAPITPPGSAWVANPPVSGLPTSTTGTTTFTVNLTGANNDNQQSGSVAWDNITFTGCAFVPPPNVAKSFATDPILVGGTPSLLTFTVANNTVTSPTVYDPVPLTAVNVSDTLPSGLEIVNNGTFPASTQCSNATGTVSAPNGGTTMSITGASLAAGASCTFSVYVRGTSPGTFQNVSGFVSGTFGEQVFTNTGTNGFATDTITVIAPPVIAKSFGAGTIQTGSTTSLGFVITNPNTGTSLTNVSFTDTLPAGLVVATPNGLTGTCGGGTITATAGTGSVTLSGATLAPLAACTFSVNVLGTTAGTKNNSVTVSSTEAAGNTSNASLVVQDPIPGIALLKQVGLSPTGPWTSFLPVDPLEQVYYQLTIENIGDVPLSPVSVTDPDPAIDLSSCVWTDPLPVADINDDDHIDTCVVGPVSALDESHPNTATASGTYNSTTVTDTSTATYSTEALTLVKSALDISFNGEGVVLNYSYGVTNTGDIPLADPVTVADDMVNGQAGTVNCPSNPDGDLDPGETLVCTATYTTTAGDVTAGQVTNTAQATADGVTSNEDDATVPLAGSIDLAVSKTDGQTTVETGSSITYTILVQNFGPSVDGATVHDPVVAGLSKTAVGSCAALGGATCPAPANLTVGNLEAGTLSIPSLPVNSSISFTVTATVSATSAFTNTVTVTKETGLLTENSTDNNTASDTNQLAKNYGHLPSDYEDMNLIVDGGAETLSGTTFLGGGKTTATDGINTATFTLKATDDGVTWTPGFQWMNGGSGSFNIEVTCPSSPCYLNGWIDWNVGDPDFDFLDAGEHIFDNREVGNGETGCTGSGPVYSCELTFPIPAGALPVGFRENIFARFRLTNDEMDGPFPNGTATGGGIPLVGEIEDYVFQVQNSVTPTPVTVGFFRTFREGGDTVLFRWATATESGNAGFNLYVERNGRLVKINDELIPARGFDSLDRIRYAYRGEVAGDTFFIEDVSVRGTTRRHGPFKIERAYGLDLIDQKVPWTAVHREHVAAQQAQQLAIAAEHSAVWGAARTEATTVLLEVRKTGVQRVTYDALRAAGVALPDSVDKLFLFDRNGQVPIYSPSKKFAAGSHLEFYGQALDTTYTDTNVYALKLGGNGAPLSIKAVDGAPTLVPALPSSYTETFTFDRRRAYATHAPSNDPWYDTSMFVTTAARNTDFTFQLEGLTDPWAPATIELVAWGVTATAKSPDHHLIAAVNGTQVLDETFDGIVEKVWTIDVPSGVLRNGANTLRLTLPADTGVNPEIVYFVRMKVRYERHFQARDGRLAFTRDGRDFQVANLPSGDVVVYRLDGHQGPQRLMNVQVQASGAGFAATFSREGSNYFVSTTAALYAPSVRLTRTNSDLSRAAQYLVISHPDFIAGLEPLVQAREAKGLTVNVVDVNDIYASYSFGVVDPQAIKSYIAFAAKNLGIRSVLIVGGDTSDYRNYLGRNSISFVPSLYTATNPQIRFVPSDALYADLDGDGVPNLAIGRFPVRTRAELDMVIAKTLAYETKGYGRTALFASDRREGGLSFKNYNLGFQATMPPGWSTTSISLDDADVNTARTALLAGMNAGTSLVTFTGHSGPREWASGNLFTTTHAATLSNAGKPFVVVQWGCWNTYHVDPVNVFLVQSFLFSGDRGAAAVMGASTLTDAGSEYLLGRLLTPRLTTPGMTIGEALLEAKLELAKTHPHLADVLVGWTLMGDPELVIEP